MRRSASLLVLLACACSSDDETNPPEDPARFSAAAATNIVITEVAAYQTLKIPLGKNGVAVPRGSVPLVAGRNAVVRVFVALASGWRPKTVIARLKLESPTPTGTLTKTFQLSRKVVIASKEDEIASTFNFEIPGEYIRPDTKFAALLTEPGLESGREPDESPTRYPTKRGVLDTLTVQEGSGQLKVGLVPVVMRGEPPMQFGPQDIKNYEDEFYALFPATKVTVVPIEPPLEMDVPPDTGSVLNALLGNPAYADPTIYYYGVIPGAGGGLSFVGHGPSCGSPDIHTMTHEVGHAHGLQHAPCGGPAGVDPNYPYPDGSTGHWGYHLVQKQLFPPEFYKDLMTYCGPSWVSDYHYLKMLQTLQARRAQQLAYVPTRYRQIVVTPEGDARVGRIVTEAGPLEGEELVARYEDEDGAVLEEGTARFFPYDHLPGGLLLVPEEPSRAVSVAVRDRMGRPWQTVSLRAAEVLH